MAKQNKLCRRLICLFLAVAAALTLAMPAVAVVGKKPVVDTVTATTPQPQKPSTQKTVGVMLQPYSWAPQIGFMEDGKELEVLQKTGDYYKIDCYDMDGYIHKSLVREEEGRYYTQYITNSAYTKEFTTKKLMETIPLKGDLYNQAMRQRGIRYLLGGTNRNGFDCCGLMNYVYANCGLELPWGVEGQLAGGLIIPTESLQCGDLVFFNKTNHPTYYVTHVGMYIGDGKFIHAGGNGVTVAELDSVYFAPKYLCARRFLLADSLEAAEPVTAVTAVTTLQTPSFVRRRDLKSAVN